MFRVKLEQVKSHKTIFYFIITRACEPSVLSIYSTKYKFQQKIQKKRAKT
jgi:hypothetical protein